MKKIYLLLVSVLALGGVAMTSCSGGGNSPANIEVSIWKQIQKGNYDKAVNLMVNNGDIDQSADKSQLKMLLSGFMSFQEEEIKSRGGLTKIEIAEEEIDTESGTADVTLLFTYGDGEQEEHDAHYILRDKKWRKDLGLSK